MNFKPTSEEKLWSVIAHLSILFSGMGMLMPSFAWAEHRKTSHRVAFQTLQALGYQSLGYTLWAVAALLVLTVLTIATLPMIRNGENINLFITEHIVVTVVLYIPFLLVAVYGAVMSGLGRDFRYPLLGDRLARMIGYNPSATPDAPLDETAEERFAAAMAHFAVIYPLTGMLPALVFLSLPGTRSPYMRFHALQTLIFQAISTLVTLGLALLTFIFFMVGLITVIMPYLANPNTYQPTIESFIPFFLFLISLAIFVLIAPLYQIIGQWAGLRVLQGHNYHYAVIGKLVNRWLEKQERHN
jgi:uncharacterized Tic20 family protein